MQLPSNAVIRQLQLEGKALHATPVTKLLSDQLPNSEADHNAESVVKGALGKQFTVQATARQQGKVRKRVITADHHSNLRVAFCGRR